MKEDAEPTCLETVEVYKPSLALVRRDLVVQWRGKKQSLRMTAAALSMRATLCILMTVHVYKWRSIMRVGLCHDGKLAAKW